MLNAAAATAGKFVVDDGPGRRSQANKTILPDGQFAAREKRALTVILVGPGQVCPVVNAADFSAFCGCGRLGSCGGNCNLLSLATRLYRGDLLTAAAAAKPRAFTTSYFIFCTKFPIGRLDYAGP